MSIDANISGPLDNSNVEPTEEIGSKPQKTTSKSSQSTISESQVEAALTLYFMNAPVLASPSGGSGGSSDLSNAAAIQAMERAGIAQVGSDIWDKYLDYLAEE